MLLLLLEPTATNPVDIFPVAQKDVRSLHRHTAEVWNQVGTVRVTCDVAFRTPTSVLASERKHVTAVATPVRADVGDRLETMRDTVVDFLGVVVLNNLRELTDDEPELPELTPVFDFDIHFVTTLS